MELAAKKIADNFCDSEHIESLASTLIKSRVDSLFKETMTPKIDAFLLTEMEKIVSQEIAPINIWGEKAGQPTTIRDALAARAKDFWNQKVDSDGKASDYYGNKPRHEWLFAKIVNEEFAKAVKQNIVNLVGAFKDALSESANKITKEHIDSLIKVKTPNS